MCVLINFFIFYQSSKFLKIHMTFHTLTAFKTLSTMFPCGLTILYIGRPTKNITANQSIIRMLKN